jgi:hypothetical protein
MLERVSFEFKGKEYKTEPITVGRVVDFYKDRVALTSGNYSHMVKDFLGTPPEVLNMVSCEAFLFVFCPDVVKAMLIQSIFDLGLEDAQEILQIYVEKFVPFIDELQKVLAKKE